MKKAFFFTIKTVVLVFLLILVHTTITYTVEQLGLVSIKPLTISNVRESHIANILAPFPFLVIWGGWLYFLAFLVFHKIVNKFAQKSGFWIQLGLGVAVAMFFFLFWWTFGELFDPEYLREGLIVYPITGIALALLHMLFFKTDNPE